jgi:predicted nucleic acid-binding protein
MPADVLADTGAILALLNREDRWHRKCLDAFRQISLPLITSQAVLTEIFHITGTVPWNVEAAWTFIRSGNLVLTPILDVELPFLHALMSRYADRPMDFADATLVHLAQRESLNTIFTIDHDDFETYRIDGRRRFRVIPAR